MNLTLLYFFLAGKYGKATLVPVVMLAVAVIGCIIGTVLFFKYSRFIKARRS